MAQKILLSTVEFGQPEAEHDYKALRHSFYESQGWRRVSSARQLPFLVGRKGSGKSAVSTRLEIESENDSNCGYFRIVPEDFRHVEIRELLSTLVNSSTSWQYIYSKVWEGIILGQIIFYLSEYQEKYGSYNPSDELTSSIAEFRKHCDFYVAAIHDALSEVLSKYVTDVTKKTDELTLIQLRKMLEPYNWIPLFQTLRDEFANNPNLPGKLIIVIDGLDEHWDVSNPSLHFLAQLLSVTKKLTAKFDPSIQFLVCLRDNIFRALVDTKSVEYDKLESLIINLQWDPSSLFELIARRVAPKGKLDVAVCELRELLPDDIDGVATDEYLGNHILNRPRDYVNFFRMLQANCGSEARAGSGHVHDTLSQYCANRLVDLENEFGITYPGISRCVESFANLRGGFSKETLLASLSTLISEPSFRSAVPELITHYGEPIVLARILISIGVIGCYKSETHSLRFVHEFSESRVATLWDSTELFGIHPVYQFQNFSTGVSSPASSFAETEPAIEMHPSDYLPGKDAPGDLVPLEQKKLRKRKDLIAELASINPGRQHFQRWENWVKFAIEVSFSGDLLNSEGQVAITGGAKRFDVLFDIPGQDPPWGEIKGKYATHRLLVECKNTDAPTDADFSKLVRDMDTLDFKVAFLAYRASSREPNAKVLGYQRSWYQNRKKECLIIAVTEGFLLQCLKKKTIKQCRRNLNALWKDHTQRWLPI